MKRLKFLFLFIIFLFSSKVFASNYIETIYLNGKEFTNSFTTVFSRKVDINYFINASSINANNVSLSFCTDTKISNIKSTLKSNGGIEYIPQKNFELLETGSSCMFSNSSYTGGKISIIKFTHNFKDFDCVFGDCRAAANFTFDISSNASFQLMNSTVSFDKISDSSIQNAEAEKTRKGILKTIIELPKKIVNLIIDGLKSLFIPKDGFFKGRFQYLFDTFSDKFGILFYPFELLADFTVILTEFCLPGDGILDIPDIKEPFSGVVLIKSHSYDLGKDFKMVLGEYYSLYQAVVYGICIILFCKFLYNFYVKTFGDKE